MATNKGVGVLGLMMRGPQGWRVGAAIVSAVIAIVGLVYLLPGGPDFVRHGTTPAPTATPGTANVGSKVSIPPDVTPGPMATSTSAGQPGQASAKPSDTAFELTIVDSHQRNPARIPVQYSGAATGRVLSDAKGHARITGPAGDYSFQVPVGCTDDILVTFGASGRGRIVEGQVTTGQLRADWVHRFAPGPPVFASMGPDWYIGEAVTLRVSIGDRCNDGAKASNAAFPTYSYRPGPMLKVDGAPALKANADGYAEVRVVCTAKGAAQMTAVDTTNESDSIEIAAAESTFGARPNCVPR